MKPNKHKKCGGTFVKIKPEFYRCNRCGMRRDIYKKRIK
jgi:hypothetical protein